MKVKLLALTYVLLLYTGIYAYDINAIVNSSKSSTNSGSINSQKFVQDSKKSLEEAKDDYYWKYEYVSPEQKASYSQQQQTKPHCSEYDDQCFNIIESVN